MTWRRIIASLALFVTALGATVTSLPARGRRVAIAHAAIKSTQGSTHLAAAAIPCSQPSQKNDGRTATAARPVCYNNLNCVEF